MNVVSDIWLKLRCTYVALTGGELRCSGAAISRRFIEEIFNARKLEAAKNFITPDIIYHGIAEEVRGLEDFKKVGYSCDYSS